MADFNKSIPIILKWEGGFGHYPEDPGGATNRGITFALFKEYAKELGLLPDINGLKSLTEEQAKHIYKIRFWDVMKGDLINDQNVANIIFDAFVNMGTRALKMAQKEIGVMIDGNFGHNTITVLNQANARTVFEGFKDARILFYKQLAERKPEMHIFLNGWLNRVNSFEYVA